MLIDLFYKYFVFPFYKFRLGKFGNHSVILKPLKIQGGKNIYIENNVIVQKYTWLAAVPLLNSGECRLIIREGSAIGHFNHIYATKSIIIGKNVLTADKVYISDNQHNYINPEVPVMDQGVLQLSEVSIGNGTWIGENACIIGAKIGRNCVIGANSIVKSDIPDYCVVAGAPAKIIKRYDFHTKKWERTNRQGGFIHE